MTASSRIVSVSLAALCISLLVAPIAGSTDLDGVIEIGDIDDGVTVAGTDNTCWTYKRSERRFARKINAARLLQGTLRLKLDPELSRAARKHTREMWTANELHHTPSDKLRRRVTNWVILGENVGVGGTVDSLHRAFMNSKGHRDNILHVAYRHVGIGVAQKNGRMWVTVIFQATDNPGTRLRMPTC